MPWNNSLAGKNRDSTGHFHGIRIEKRVLMVDTAFFPHDTGSIEDAFGKRRFPCIDMSKYTNRFAHVFPSFSTAYFA